MDEKPAHVVSLEEAAKEPYSIVLSYPKLDTGAVKTTIRQLKELGVDRLEFTGTLRMGALSLLGKGVAGMVLVGLMRRERVALKIRRLDSRRTGMEHEAFMLQLANSVDVGPKYLASTRDVLAMELVEGDRLPIWLSGLKGRGRRRTVKAVIRMILEQCFRLDQARLDHGELSRAHKNVLVSAKGQPCILDFESASLNRRPANFTSVTQYFFLGGGFSRKIVRVLGPTNREALLELLRLYKTKDFEEARCRTFELLKL